MKTVLMVAAVAIVAGCASNSADIVDLNGEGATCGDPRPMVCTMEYRPVCATLVAGGEKTYASGCNACADIAVASHVPNACETP